MEIWKVTSQNCDVWNSFEEFNSREEAIQYGKEEYEKYKNGYASIFDDYEDFDSDKDKYKPKIFFIGKREEFNPCVNAEFVIENITQDAYDQAGEVSESYLSNISSEEMNDLQEQLTNIFLIWQEKYKHAPNFYKISNIEEIPLGE